ncbi:hypothetical protein Leryth_001729 [Lithospermum erythrorhizon]|nr:hypothetical protein Leryth_001729 [Lithospermum erythrorhizon]
MTRLKGLYLPNVNISSSLPKNLSSSLTIIDLSYTHLKGTFPYHIFHLPNVQQISLSDNSFDDFVSSESVKWNTSSSLQKLELAGVVFPGKLLDTIGNLNQLTYLDLSGCELNGTLPQSFGNLTQISHLDLSVNGFSGHIPLEILGLEHLTFLDLHMNQLNTSIPQFASNNMKMLKALKLSGNKLTTRSVSSILSNLTQLEIIDLSDNCCTRCPCDGPIETKTFSNLVNLKYLNLASNNLSGPIETKTFSNLVNLTSLDLSSNNFGTTLDVNFLSRLKSLRILDLSFSSLALINEDNITLPMISIDSLRLICNISDLDIWHQLCKGRHFKSSLKSNLLNGQLPILPQSIESLDLSNNQFHGEIKPSICELSLRVLLDLSNNSLNGALPHCIGMIGPKSDLHRIIFVGTIPRHFPMNSLLMSPNFMWEEFQCSLSNCSNLEFLDLSENNLNDTFPIWLGNLPNLTISRSNKAYIGPISFPPHASTDAFSQLQILDLSYNQLNGSLPFSLFRRLRQMMSVDETMLKYSYYFGDEYPKYVGDQDYHDSMTMVLNGNLMQLERIQSSRTGIDLSSNHFEGEIPSSIEVSLQSNNSICPTITLRVKFHHKLEIYPIFTHLTCHLIS